MKVNSNKTYYVYILTNYLKTVLYIGVTNNLKRRLQEHKRCDKTYSFTSRYQVFYLVYFERFNASGAAINRETQLKKWSREKKDSLIHDFNSELSFLNHLFEE